MDCQKRNLSTEANTQANFKRILLLVLLVSWSNKNIQNRFHNARLYTNSIIHSIYILYNNPIL